MAIGLFSRCMGGVSAFAAMTRFPAVFDGVRCLVSFQPVTPRYIVERRLAAIGRDRYRPGSREATAGS
ncbi:MAG: hypothetical protein ACRDOU_23165 [Streptosporangiaceae bacterium]